MSAVNRKKYVGKVVSDKMDKTIVVQVDRRFQHPFYKKYVKRCKNYKAHDESGEAGIGDRVEIVETRPLSRTKRWALNRVVEKAKIRGV